jgi:hypothetical protein
MKTTFKTMILPNWESELSTIHFFPFPSDYEVCGYAYRPFLSVDLFVVYKEEENINLPFHQVEPWTFEKDESMTERKEWVLFHTHPRAVYQRYQSIFAFPSLRDISNFFRHSLDLPREKYHEMVWTLEGIYHFILTPRKKRDVYEFQQRMEELSVVWKSKETKLFFQQPTLRPHDFCWWLQNNLRIGPSFLCFFTWKRNTR